MRERGLSLDHTTIYRWVQAYAPESEKRIRSHLRLTNDSYRVEETYIKIKGEWKYLYRAVDSTGQTIDFLLRAKRDSRAAKRFFRKMLKTPSHSSPRVINVDKNRAYPQAVEQLKEKGRFPTALNCDNVNISTTSSSRIIGSSKGASIPGSGSSVLGRQVEQSRVMKRCIW